MENKIPYHKRKDVKKRNAERMKKKYHNMTDEEKKQFLEHRKLIMKRYREKHREELNAKMREYNRVHSDKKRETNKKYYYGIRSKKCDFCNGIKDISNKVFEDGSTYSDCIMQVKITTDIIYGTALEVTPVEYKNGQKRKRQHHHFYIKYCPMCGKKLGEKNEK